MLIRMLSLVKLSVDPVEVITFLVFLVLLVAAEYRPLRGLLSDKLLNKLKKHRAALPTVKDIPGPTPLPVIGTRWVYSIGRYKLNKVHEAYKDMFIKYGAIVKEEALWNFPVVSLISREDIQKVLRYTSKYPLRPPTEVTAYYRQSRPDRYTNLGLVNERMRFLEDNVDPTVMRLTNAVQSQFCASRDTFYGLPILKAFPTPAYKELINSEDTIYEQGETWHNLRSHLTPELTSSATMQRFLPELNQVADDFNTLLVSTRDKDGIVRNFEELANRMGLESTCTLILGRRMRFLEDNVDPTSMRLANAVQSQFRASRDTFYGLPIWKAFPTPAYNELINSEDTIYDIISELVESALKEEQDTCEVDGVKSVFMAILQSPGLDIRDKKAGIIDFIAAGIKTLGNTLVFLLYLVAKHPRVQKRLYEEVIGLAPPGTPVTSQVLSGATYLRACIMEAFRVLPTAPCVARILETDMELSGYHLNAGSVVLCHTWLASQQEYNFTSATEFLPERWLSQECTCSSSEESNKQSSNSTHKTVSEELTNSIGSCNCSHQQTKSNSFLVVPFGVGRRMCPGKRFVHLELQVVLAQTVRQFEIEYDGELDLEFEFLLAPAAPANFRLKDRI